jgi:geranylgeranyl reductase family protein
MRVGIVGAGPAGAHLAHILGSRGFEVLLFDARDAWEKPCGGGVTSKALREYTFLQDNQSPKEMVSKLRLLSGQGRRLMLKPREEFAIYSRAELGRLMRHRATSSGAELHCTRVEKTDFNGVEWQIQTSHKTFTVDFLVGADGASSVVRRRVGVHFGLEDLTYALGWLVRPDRPRPHGQADIKYLADLTGYIWIFPRPDHVSYGIASKFRERTPADLKARLLDFMEAEDPEIANEIRSADHHSTPRATFYGAMIPALEPATWDRLSAASEKEAWALIGDAAGFVDPLTGEGIYYAIKSAELLADALPSRVAEYDSMWRAAFGLELRRAAELQQRFYHGEFAGAPLIERMLQFGRWHRGVRRTLADLITGDQGYLDLKETLKKRSFAII